MTEWTPEEEAVARAIHRNRWPEPWSVLTPSEQGQFISDARAAIAAMQPRWRDVKTDPPPRGERVLTFGGGFVGTSRYVEVFAPIYGETGPGWYSDQLGRRHDPLFWQPLPPAPEPKP